MLACIRNSLPGLMALQYYYYHQRLLPQLSLFLVNSGAITLGSSELSLLSFLHRVSSLKAGPKKEPIVDFIEGNPPFKYVDYTNL